MYQNNIVFIMIYIYICVSITITKCFWNDLLIKICNYMNIFVYVYDQAIDAQIGAGYSI